MLLYHGSNTHVDAPKLQPSNRGLDFGTGFYLTSSKDQAERFSEIVTRRNGRSGRGVPTVSVYELDWEAALLALKTKKLTDQYCLKSTDALARLTFVQAYAPDGRL